MSSHQRLQPQLIPTGVSCRLPFHVIHPPSPHSENLAPNNIDASTHLLKPVISPKLFQN